MAKIAGGIPALLRALRGVVEVLDDEVKVLDEAALAGEVTDTLVYSAVFGTDSVRPAARWIIWMTAQAVGLHPASIHDLYLAAGRGEYANATTPAINVRGMSYDFARTIFRTGQQLNTKNFIFEIARSEMGYTEQTPEEFATVMIAAGLREGYRGPVFIQGDHQQINPKRYKADPERELNSLRKLIGDSVEAGFYNIDVDASTIVELDKPTEFERQELNYKHTAEMTAFIREIEPKGITVSVGGEIGEVGTEDSTPEDLEAFMQGYVPTLQSLGDNLAGISKISVQTGTSHGGVVLPDGSIAEVKLNLQALGDLSTAARKYGMGGAVQHGASTLPDSAFDQFAQRGAIEVHLATAFQNMMFDDLPEDFRQTIYEHLDENHDDERKPNMTPTQFYYTTRKRAYGPFKREFWFLPDDVKARITGHLGEKFAFLFTQLGVAGQADLVDKHTKLVKVAKVMPEALTNAIHASIGE
jgi:fructose/tagatose bisphosphate aldolase